MTTRKIEVDINEDLYQKIDGAGYRMEIKGPEEGDLVWIDGQPITLQFKWSTAAIVLHPKPSEPSPQHEQAELTSYQKERAIAAYNSILGIGSWKCLPDGDRYWRDVATKLYAMHKHGTSDGQPLRQAERWVTPDDEMAKGRPACEVRDDDDEWMPGILLAVDQSASADDVFTVRANGIDAFWRQCRVRVDADGKPVG